VRAARSMGALAARDACELAGLSDYIIIAVKPQVIGDALRSIPQKLIAKKTLISIAAGIKIKKIAETAGIRDIPVIRVMPNTPALTGEGACAYAVSKQVSKKAEKFASKMLSTFCKVCVKVEESELDAVTAISGSGPAYFFYFAEAMLDAADAMGFKRDTAKALIIQTMAGSAELLKATGEEPEKLRAKVTSKGGTTERAIEGMNKNGLKEIIRNSVIAAQKRAEELGR